MGLSRWAQATPSTGRWCIAAARFSGAGRRALREGHTPRSSPLKTLAGDTAREATSDEVKELKAEARQLKETLAEVLIENRLLKKSVLGDREDAS